MTDRGDRRSESVFGLGRQLISGVVTLARTEVLHGRQEMAEMLASTRAGAIRIGIGVALLLLALIAFVGFAILGISTLTGLPGWLVALILFIVFGLLAGILAYSGIRGIRVGPPSETIASVREDIAWAKRLLRRD